MSSFVLIRGSFLLWWQKFPAIKCKRWVQSLGVATRYTKGYELCYKSQHPGPYFPWNQSWAKINSLFTPGHMNSLLLFSFFFFFFWENELITFNIQEQAENIITSNDNIEYYSSKEEKYCYQTWIQISLKFQNSDIWKKTWSDNTLGNWCLLLSEKEFTCIPHSIDMVREVDSPNDIFETQYPRANAAAWRRATGNINCAPWVLRTSETCPIWIAEIIVSSFHAKQLLLKHYNGNHQLKSFKLTGLAHRRVVRITPIKGVTETIFEVNLGKNSFANTARKSRN